MTNSKPPQTFEEWRKKQEWHSYNGFQITEDDKLQSAFAAGVASQQATIIQLREVLRDVRSENFGQLVAQLAAKDDALVAATTDLRRTIARYEAVVEAAQAYVDRLEAEAARLEPWNAPEIDERLRAALAKVEEKS